MANTVMVSVASEENMSVISTNISSVQTDTGSINAVDLTGSLAAVDVNSVADVGGISIVTSIDVTS